MITDEHIISEMDQAVTTAVQVAGMVAEYYATLKTLRLPDDLAQKLTVNFQDVVWGMVHRGPTHIEGE